MKAPLKLLIPLAAVLAGVGIAFLIAGGADTDEASRTANAAVARVHGKPPVVLLILDEFPVDSLLRPDGSIDAARFPNFAALASTSTWFRNSSTIYDSTPKAIPASRSSPNLRPRLIGVRG